MPVRQVFQHNRPMKFAPGEGHQKFIEYDVAIGMPQRQMLHPRARAAIGHVKTTNNRGMNLHILQKLRLGLVKVAGVVTCAVALKGLQHMTSHIQNGEGRISRS